MKRILALMLPVAVVGIYYGAGLDQRLTLEGIKSSLQAFSDWNAKAPALVAAAYFLGYMSLSALALPGAALITLVAGALFGVVRGTLIVSFASSSGALLAFLVSRYLLRDFVQQRFDERLKTINAGIAKDGPFYLFTLRLVPLVPFFIINLLMGLTSMRPWTFYWVSQIGMLAGTVVYVNAGTQLAQIDHLSGLLSPGLLLSFTLLGIFPWLTKLGLNLWQRRRIYGRWKCPARFDRNIVVIGAGAAGLVTSYIAAAVKAKVTLVEAGKMGGDCLNYGCVPSKALIRSAKLAHQIRHADHYGLTPSVHELPFQHVMARVREVIRTVAPHDSVERYTGLGVEVWQGYARIVDPWTVEVTLKDGEKRRLTTRSIVIATGAKPFVPLLPGIENSDYVTSDTLWEEFAKRDTPPGRVVVLGGGPIGTELAQALARLGSEVTQVEKGDRILAREDAEVSDLARQALEQNGVQVLTAHSALRCERVDDQKYLVVSHQGQEKIIPFDVLICAVGRVARLEGYGLEELGIPVERTVTTNDYLETLYPNIYAAGDVVGPYQFTHMAAHQAWYAAVNGLFGSVRKFKVDYRVVPWTTFIDPEVARVGLNEQEAKAQGIAYEVTRYGLDDLDRAIADGAAHGFVKVLTVPGKDKILGVTLVGEHAGDLIAEFVLAMKWGLGLNKILSTIHTYPTWAEANRYAAGEWKRAHVSRPILVWLEYFHDWRRG
ncbi:FAD-dependent oxidoreductase [Ferrovum sp.]|uniref:FAD-dependent oxidoreductase n=1 Tax=Ferrovum sp. TaxID=2609467 RepID=UPI00261E02F7|nr:bifunctional TVP38/TMEM64 family protein/FAD-dependent oxidoreductase [Ferrovum sp.]